MKTDIRIISIVIWDGKAYVPSTGRYVNDGPFSDIEPIHVVDLDFDKLLSIVKMTLSKRPVILPEPSREEVKARKDLLPKVTGAGNWKRLCQKGISYLIEQSPDGFLLEMSRLDDKGRWEFDESKSTRFPPRTDLSLVVQTMLNDLKTRQK